MKKYCEDVANVNIDTDPKLKKVLRNVQEQIIKSGKGGVRHHPEISPEDLILMYHSFDDTPQGLQNKVMFTIMFLMCRHRAENIRGQIKTTFAVKTDADGIEFLIQVSWLQTLALL